MTNFANLPVQLIERWKELYSDMELQEVTEAIASKQLISFRTNTLKTKSEALKKSLTRQGFLLTQLHWYPSAFILNNKSIGELTETEEYKNGLLYIQNPSSMIPPVIMNPKENEKILDLTAAPGSKATQIAMITNNNAVIVANDNSRTRLYKMERILHDYGIPFSRKKIHEILGMSRTHKDPSMIITNFRGEKLWQLFPEFFDKTLVDVPCSMEGRINSDDPKTYRDWSIKKIKQLSRIQKYLLRSAVSATRVGGTIVYSTCTLSPEENEEVIEWVVDKTPEALTVEKINIPGLPLQAGLTSWKKKKFIHTVNCARIFPSHIMEGFFVTKLTKKLSTLP